LNSDKKYVREYLHKNAIVAEPDFTVKQVKIMVMKYQHIGFPVVKDRKLVGFISILDILFKDPNATIDKFMKKDVIVATPDMDLYRAAKIMWRNSVYTLPVIEEDNKFVGVITNKDILRAQIEHSSEDKVLKIKKMLEDLHNCKINIIMKDVVVKNLIPTQTTIDEDELQGRIYEMKRKLNEPIIVLSVNNKEYIIDGHHRALAAVKLGIDKIHAYVLTSTTPVKFGYEETANKLNIKSIMDIKIEDDKKILY